MNIVKPFLPPIDEFIVILRRIWDSKILTNSGPIEQELEKAIEEYLEIKHVSLVSNGTTALIFALKALGLKGEVITTPYTFAATTNVLAWCDLTPVFVDVLPDDLNLNPALIEAAITEKTCAILALHAYGNPCDTDAIDKISKRYKIPVVYDACHAFGVRHNGKSLLEHGDFSAVSFHATKVFNTFEGGMVISKDQAGKEMIDRLKNFGFENEVTIKQSGINGKMAEVNAALGLAQLPYMDKVNSLRKSIDDRYRKAFSEIKQISCLPIFVNGRHSYSYFPILIHPHASKSRDEVVSILKKQNINVRKYFYPLISEFPAYESYRMSARNVCSIAYEASLSVICLPIYPDLAEEEQSSVIEAIIRIFQH
jgi:dTDP-4-amino-4,6-dideoxygalactose transaminase